MLPTIKKRSTLSKNITFSALFFSLLPEWEGACAESGQEDHQGEDSCHLLGKMQGRLQL